MMLMSGLVMLIKDGWELIKLNYYPEILDSFKFPSMVTPEEPGFVLKAQIPLLLKLVFYHTLQSNIIQKDLPPYL